MLSQLDGNTEGWDRFWRELPNGEPPIWESRPKHAAERDIRLYSGYAKTALPLIDVGCGLGAQTRALAAYFPYVIGADISQTAVQRAASDPAPGNTEFRQLDLTNHEQVARFTYEFGPCNVYMRSVLHQMNPGDRPAVLTSIATVLQRTGVALNIELTPQVVEHCRELLQQEGGPPPRLARVEQYGIVPAQWDWGELHDLIVQSGMGVLDAGDAEMVSSEKLNDRYVRLPMMYRLFG